MADSGSIAETIEQMNWEKADHDDFMKALNQSLLIQTPLQVLLEMMFKRMSTQSKEVEIFKEKLEFIEKSSIDVASILERVQGLEGSVKELTDSKLSPFTQADILERLDKAEFTAQNAMKRVNGALQQTDQVQAPRISRMERQLKGVENLPGRLLAVDEIAEELGIQIPNTEFEWEDEPQQHLEAPQSKSNRLGMLQKKIVEVEKENGAMKGTIKNLHKEMQGLKISLSRAQDNSAALLSGIEDKNKEIRRQMSQELLAAKREMSPTEGTSYSDFVKVMSQMEELRRDAKCSAKQVQDIKTKDIFSLQENVAALAQQVQSSAGALERESTMHKTLKKLERDMEITKKRVQNAMSAALAGGDGGSLAGLARQADLDEIVEELGKKPSKDELQKIVSKAVDVALDSVGSVPSNADPNYSGRALKFRCLSCDREVVTQRPRPLGHLPSKQGFVPKFESVPPRDAPTPLGPGLNAAELRKLQNLAAQRLDLRDGSPTSMGSPRDERPATAIPTSPSKDFNDQEMVRPMTSPQNGSVKSFAGPFPTRPPTRSGGKPGGDKSGSKAPVFVS